MAKQFNPRAFNANWKEKDESMLLDLLHHKVRDLSWEIRHANTPYVRQRLRAKRSEYRSLLKKVNSGDYNGDIIFAELSSAYAYQHTEVAKKDISLSKYASSYNDVDFDFNRYFLKTRYFGAAAPIFTIILATLLIFVILMGGILPQSVISSVDGMLSGDDGEYFMGISSIGYFKLSPGDNDFRIDNDGNWPQGRWQQGKELKQGEKFKDRDGIEPEKVFVYADLGMLTIDITTYDVIKAFFRIPLMSKYRIDFIENLPIMEGRSWYFAKFLNDRADISIEKGPDGSYDAAAIVRHIASYGVIVFLILTLLCALIVIFQSIFQLFSYTTRKIHLFPVLTFVFAMLTLVSPLFTEIKTLDGDGISAVVDNYFALTKTTVIESEAKSMFIINIVMFVILALPLISIFVPKLFRNRTRTPIMFVPKGNKPPRQATYDPKLYANTKGKKGKRKGKPAVSTAAPAPYLGGNTYPSNNNLAARSGNMAYRPQLPTGQTKPNNTRR